MKRFFPISLIILVLFFSFSCGEIKDVSTKKTQQEILLHKSSLQLHDFLIKERNLKEKALDLFVEQMSLQEKVCQMFIVNIDGNQKYYPIEKMSLICKDDESFIVPGGCLFFGFNLADSVEQVINFTDSITNYCIDNTKIPPFLSVDQEGGSVNRLRKLTGLYPSAQSIVETMDLDSASTLFELQAKQMKLLGFNLNLAPVVEECTENNKSFLDGRSYGDLDAVLNYGKINIQRFENNGVGTVLKHFPGNSNTDPHTGLPEIELNENDLFKSLKTFENLIKYNPSGVLMSHARTKAIDSEKPACLSSIWVTDILRNNFCYKGIIFSDDIFMGALASNNYPPEKAVLMAVDAGIDSIMISEKRFASAAKVLYNRALSDEEFMKKIDDSVKRIIKFKIEKNILKYNIIRNDDSELIEIIPVYPENPKSRAEELKKYRMENNNLFYVVKVN